METLYVGCFLFGAAFTAVSFALGHVGFQWHGHGHAHGYLHDGHAHAHDDRSPAAFLSLPALLAFLTWFGAVGYVLSRWGVPGVLAAVPAIAFGAAAWLLMTRLLAMIRAGERVLDPADYRLPGTIGHLTVGIPEDGVGEVVFTKAGARRSEAARAADGRALARGAEVVITGYEHGIATVQPWDEFVSGKGRAQ
jgi:hypothetical protein